MPPIPDSLGIALRDVMPIGIAVTGWIVVHFLTLRAQREALRNKILDDARLEIVPRIRDYQAWLSELSTWASGLVYERAAIAAKIPVDIYSRHQQLFALESRKSDHRAWGLLLEDYEILFPETCVARKRLSRRDLRIQYSFSAVHDILSKLMFGPLTVEGIDEAIGAAKAVQPLIEDQSAMLEDLRVHLQVTALGPIMDRTMRRRVPLDPSVPRLWLMDDGYLDVVDATGKRLDNDELPLPGGEAFPDPDTIPQAT